MLRSAVAGRYDEVVTGLRSAGCVFAEDEARLLVQTAQTPAELDRMVAERSTGLPLEQVLGWAEFCGLRIAMEPGVFVPRRRTELLVREAAAAVRPGAVVLDLCCGTGAVGAALLATLPDIDLYASDVDPAAVRCARRNLAASGTVHQGDLYDALPRDLRGRVDVITANAPYVPSSAIHLMPPEARLHEPLTALDGGGDGVDLHRRIAAGAPSWLVAGGLLIIETSEEQAPRTSAAMSDARLRPAVRHDEELDATVVSGRLAPAGLSPS